MTTVSEADRILVGDAFEMMATLPDAIADLIFVDPPYWMRLHQTLLRVDGTRYDGADDAWDNQFANLEDYEAFTRRWLCECKRLLKPNGSLWVIGGMQCIHTMGSIMQQLGFWYINEVVWHKTNPTPNFQGKRLANSHELMLWAVQSPSARPVFNYRTARELNCENLSPRNYALGKRKQLGSVWVMPTCGRSERLLDENGEKLHSTQKPEALLHRVIAICTKPGALVLDPFAGTMTTAAVAKRMGRHYLAIERDPRYVRYGAERVEHVQQYMGILETAELDEAQPRMTTRMLLDAGLLQEGDLFSLIKPPRNGNEPISLQADGSLVVGGEALDIHAAAARRSGSKAERRNGFDYWQVYKAGQWVPLKDIRSEGRMLQRMLQSTELLGTEPREPSSDASQVSSEMPKQRASRRRKSTNPSGGDEEHTPLVPISE